MKTHFVIITNNKKFYIETSLQNFIVLKSCIDELTCDIIPIDWKCEKDIPFRIQKECKSFHMGEYHYSKSVREMIDFLQVKKLYENFKHSKNLMNGINSPFPETISQIKFLYNKKLDFDSALFTLFEPYIFYNLLSAFYIKRNNPNIKILLGGPAINDSIAVRNFLSTFEGIEVKTGNITEKESTPIYDKKYNSITNGLVTLSSSIGCPYNCSFCSSNNTSFDKVDVDKFVNWIDVNQTLDHNKRLLINDPTANFSKDRFNKLLDGMAHIKNRLTTFVWLEGRNVDIDMIDKMRRANITEVFYGTDVFAESLKNKINKKSDNSIEEIIYLFKYFQKNEIQVHTNMIYGFPQETREEFEYNFNAAKKISKYARLTHSLFFLLPGSPMYKNPEKHGITLEYWEDTIAKYAIFEPDKKEIDYRCSIINDKFLGR